MNNWSDNFRILRDIQNKLMNRYAERDTQGVSFAVLENKFIGMFFDLFGIMPKDFRCLEFVKETDLHSSELPLNIEEEEIIKNLTRQGFSHETYYKYLRTPSWCNKRELVFRRDRWTCVKCERRHDQKHLRCHHLTYERVGREMMEDLVTLCGRCHNEIHGRGEFFTKNKTNCHYRKCKKSISVGIGDDRKYCCDAHKSAEYRERKKDKQNQLIRGIKQ